MLWGSGLPKGIDLNASLTTGYEAQDGAWHQLWDDSQFPGTPKNVSRFTSSELMMTWLVEITGHPFASARIMVWSLSVVSLVAMYALVFAITRSRLAAVVAAIVYVFSRGSLMQTGIPLAAGFALTPLVFPAVDRVLVEPSMRRALLLALVLALFATATIPGFTYIIAIAVLVYALSFFIGRAIGFGSKLEQFKSLGRPAGFLIVGLIVALPLAAYYVAGVLLSTIPLVRETGGYDLSDLSRNLPSLSEAVTLSRVGFRFGTPVMDATGWALAAVAVAASLLRIHFRVIALIVIATGAIFLASNVTSPAYTFLLDTLPYFSSVRGASRWLAFALFAYSVLIAIGIDAGLALIRKRVHIESAFWRGPLGYAVAWLAVIGAIGVVVVNSGVQLSGLRQWNAPYTLPEGEIPPFERIADSEPGTVFATTPFLLGRIFGPPHLSAIDFGRTVGPAISGRTAFGGFRVGGFDVEDEVIAFVQDLQTATAQRIESGELSGEPVELAGTLTDFQLLTHVSVSDGLADDEFFQVRFHELPNGSYYAFTMNPGTGRVELAQFGSTPEVLVSSQVEVDGARQYDLRIAMVGSQIQVFLDGRTILKTSDAILGSGRISALASNENVMLSDVEVVPMRRSAKQPDATLTRVMSLFNVRYFVIQPHTDKVERLRIAALPGLRLVEEWEGSALYENLDYNPAKSFFASMFGLYLGNAETVIPALYQMDSLASTKVGLLAADDIPSGLQEEIQGEAWFTALDASGPRNLQAIINLSRTDDVPPLIYTSNLSPDRTTALARPYPIPTSLLVVEPFQLLSKARNFVPEMSVNSLDSNSLPQVKFDFRVRSTIEHYSLEIDENLGRIAMLRQTRNGPITLKTATLPEVNGEATLRLVVLDDRFQVYVDNSLALDVQDDDYSEFGPVVISSEGQGILLRNIGAATDRDAQGLRSTLGKRGFDILDISESFPNIGRDHFGLFPNTSGSNVRMRGVREGSYRLLVGTVNAEDGFIASEVDSGTSKVRPTFSRIHREKSALDGQPDQVWFVSDPFEMNEGTSDVFVALSGSDAKARSIMLVEVAATPDGRELVDAILMPPEPVLPRFSRDSATNYSGDLTPPSAGLLVLQESFNTGWDAVLDGEELEQVTAFGTLNGFWVGSRQAEKGGRFEIAFAPQNAYRLSMALSSLSFLVVLGALFWTRGRRLLTAR